MNPTGIYAYIRFSREDLNAPGSLEEKYRNATQRCRDLAAKHDLVLLDDQILYERASGTKLATRPEALRLLELCRAGSVRVLITLYQDRLTRGGDHDRGTIKESLCAGGVTLITSEGVTRFDPQFGAREELMFDVKAVFASYYVRDIVQKRKDADLLRLRTQNKQPRGSAPYGYHRVSKADILAGRYSADQAGQVVVIDAEYSILEEIFRRLDAGESASSIAADLTARGVPSPGVTRPGRGSTRWHASSIYAMIRNPFYVGRNSQRARVDRGRGKVRLDPAEYVISEVRGDWPQPIDDDQHYRLVDGVQTMPERGAARTGVLSGLVHCPAGHPMRIITARQLGCDCRQRGEAHKGRCVSEARLLRWMVALLDALLTVLPPELLPAPRPQDASRAKRELSTARQQQQQQQQDVQEMMLRERYLVAQFGRDNYEETAGRAVARLEELRGRVALLETTAGHPDHRAVIHGLQLIALAGDAQAFFDTAPHEVQRNTLQGIVDRIDILPPPVRYVRDARLTLWPWAQELLPSLPPLPDLERHGTSNLIHTPEAQKRRIEARWAAKRKRDRPL